MTRGSGMLNTVFSKPLCQNFPYSFNSWMDISFLLVAGYFLNMKKDKRFTPVSQTSSILNGKTRDIPLKVGIRQRIPLSLLLLNIFIGSNQPIQLGMRIRGIKFGKD